MKRLRVPPAINHAEWTRRCFEFVFIKPLLTFQILSGINRRSEGPIFKVSEVVALPNTLESRDGLACSTHKFPPI